MLMVIMIHLGTARSDEGFLSPELPLGSIYSVAMPLFFMVSGYLLSMRKPSFEYSRRKIWGILRFCLIICIPLSAIMTVTSGDLVLLLPECFIGKGRLYQYWYFGSMMIIYAMLPYLLNIIQSKWLRPLLIGGFILCSFIFILTISNRFEEHIIITFRLWNWLFYFFLGAYIKLHEKDFKIIKWYWIIPSLVIYILLTKWAVIGGNMYCSPLCMIHSMVCFVSILNFNISDSKLVTALSDCFLPVYTFHLFIEVFLCSKTPLFKAMEHSFQTEIAYIIEYLIVVIVCISTSLALMRVPYMDKIFRI